MEKKLEYQKALLSQSDQEQFLLNNSCLPGPRSNLELLYAFIEVSELDFVESLLKKHHTIIAVNVPDEFVLCCAVAASGKFILNGHNNLISIIKEYASDIRWRIRESVAMALQYLGKYNFEKLKLVINGWEVGNYYEQRAVAAGLCEPLNLKNDAIKEFTLNTLAIITCNLLECKDRKTSDYKTLVQALCYCWSVAIVASPIQGKIIFEELKTYKDKDIQKIIRENLKKNRMIKMDKLWVNEIIATLNN